MGQAVARGSRESVGDAARGVSGEMTTTETVLTWGACGGQCAEGVPAAAVPRPEARRQAGAAAPGGLHDAPLLLQGVCDAPQGVRCRQRELQVQDGGRESGRDVVVARDTKTAKGPSHAAAACTFQALHHRLPLRPPPPPPPPLLPTAALLLLPQE